MERSGKSNLGKGQPPPQKPCTQCSNELWREGAGRSAMGRQGHIFHIQRWAKDVNKTVVPNSTSQRKSEV
ncbi:MAG: hypothetical protein DDT26_02237 [Dehalococcoidia bacterium]|nr:hypothetical protein [Chloroflexota bacterium]